MQPDTPLPLGLDGDLDDSGSDVRSVESQALTRVQAWCLYTSHFLSMWNSRAYEYGAVLFTQAVFPGDLLPSSLYGISETVCVLASSSALGQWVDGSPQRLRPLFLSIVLSRAVIVLCCTVWLFVFYLENESLRRFGFGVLLLLGMVVKMCRMLNMLGMERDWIPTVADSSSGLRTDGSSAAVYDLTHLNTVIRRIDIACKFLAPVAISGALALTSVIPTAMILAFMNISGIIELWCIFYMWRTNGTLAAPKPCIVAAPVRQAFVSQSPLARCVRLAVRAQRLAVSQIEGLSYYFSTNVWLPSIGVAVLHASVLDWSGTLIAWLLNAGFTYGEVTAAKAVGSVFEVGSTFIFPIIVEHFRKRTAAHAGVYQMVNTEDEIEEEDKDDSSSSRRGKRQSIGLPSRSHSSLDPIVRAGHIGIFELLACLMPAVLSLFFLDAAIGPGMSGSGQGQAVHSTFLKSPMLVIAFFTFLSFSFLGRWVYDLSVTQLTQTLVPASRRSQFGGTEMAMIAGVGLLHWIAAAIWHDQSDYKWLSLGSLAAVAAAAALWYVWRGRWQKGKIISRDT